MAFKVELSATCAQLEYVVSQHVIAGDRGEFNSECHFAQHGYNTAVVSTNSFKLHMNTHV